MMQIMCIVVFSIYSKSWVHSEPFAQLALSPWTTWKLHVGKRGKPAWEDGQGPPLLRSTEHPCSCSSVQPWGRAALWFLSWWLPLGLGHSCLSGKTFFHTKRHFASRPDRGRLERGRQGSEHLGRVHQGDYPATHILFTDQRILRIDEQHGEPIINSGII